MKFSLLVLVALLPLTAGAAPLSKGRSAVSKEASKALPPAPLPTEQPTTSAELREQLIISLRADIAAARKGKDPAAVAAIPQLTKAISSLIAALAATDFDPAIRGLGLDASGEQDWPVLVQASGSEKSAALAVRFLRQCKQDFDAVTAKFDVKGEELGRRAAAAVFAAKNAGEFNELRSEIDALTSAASGYPSVNISELTRFSHFFGVWQRYLEAREAGRISEAIKVVHELRGGGSSVPWIQKDELSKQIGEAAQQAGIPTKEEADILLKGWVEKAFASTKAEEVDELLTGARQLHATWWPEDEQFRSRVKGVQEFLEKWQNLLIAHASGQSSEVQNLAGNLKAWDFSQYGMVRSKLLIRLQALEKGNFDTLAGDGSKAKETAEAVLARIGTLADLEPNLAALRRAVKTDKSWQSLVQELGKIERDYRQMEAGVTTGLNAGFPAVDSRLVPLRQQLALFGIQRLAGDEAKLPPEKEESVSDYLRRLLTTARERKEWRLVLRTLDAAQTLGLHDPSIKKSDSTALSAFLAGLNQERARQFRFAVSSFQTALKNGSDWVPVEEIGEHLEKIRQDHPADFEEGVLWSRPSTGAQPRVPQAPAAKVDEAPASVTQPAAEKPEEPKQTEKPEATEPGNAEESKPAENKPEEPKPAGEKPAEEDAPAQ